MTSNQITLYKQIYPNQCCNIAKLGFKSLINLRFDNESEQQPSSHTLAEHASSTGIAYHHLPIDDTINLSHAQAFAEILNTTPKPVMVFCGTGFRAKRLYQSACILGLIKCDDISSCLP